jgi:hypothetical protein
MSFPDAEDQRRGDKSVLHNAVEPVRRLSRSEMGMKLFENAKDEGDSVTHCDDSYDETAPPTPSGSERSIKSVRWSTIEFHNHELVLGDHPSVELGPPLSIGWNRIDTDEHNIDDYESIRRERRRHFDLLLPAEVRLRVLMESGVTRSEINDCLLELGHIRESRRKSAAKRAHWLSWKKIFRRVPGLHKRGTIVAVRAFSE